MRYRFDRGVATKIKTLQTQFISSTTALVIAITGLSGGLPLFLSKTVFAIAPIDISNSTQLENAIANQADGQTWDIEAGQYPLTPNGTITAGGQTGWYLPITANDITINGIGKPTIYGNSYATNGAWAAQDLMAIFGNNVTVNGLNLMPKLEPNKTIEVIGNDATIENTTIEPNTLTSPSEVSSLPDPTEAEWGGSIYYNGAGGTQTLSNVTITNGGISYHAAAAGVHLVFNNVTLSYGTSTDWINGYRYSNHFDNPTGSTLSGTPQVVYHVSSTLGNLDDVLTNLQKGDAIELDSNLTTSQQITLTKSVTLDGNSHTISPNFAKTDNSNNSALGIQADNITVNNLIEDGTNGTNLHGINVFNATGVNLNNVTVQNNDHSGLNVDSSAVTVNNLSTANNGWDGVDVDKAGAVLTINGTSHHTETTPDIYVDNTAVGQVVDTNGQYGFVNNVKQTGDRVYDLKLSTPTLVSPADGATIKANAATLDWSDISAAGGNNPVTYQYQSSYSSSVSGSNNALSSVIYHSTTGTVSQIDATGSADATYYWQVRACDNLGVCSNWSGPWKITIDSHAPAIPTNLSWKTSTNVTVPSDGYTNVYDGTASWQDSSNDVDHYIYKYWNDISGNPYKVGSEYVTNVGSTSLYGMFNQGEGTHHFCVEAVDAADNISACSATFTITYDHTAPVVAITAPHDGDTVHGTVTISGTVTDTNPDHYYLVVKNSSNHVVAGPGTVNAANVADYHWNTTLLPDGKYTIDLEARDAASNKDSSSVQTIQVTVDNTAPSVTDNFNVGMLTGDTTTLAPTVTGESGPVTYSWVPSDTKLLTNQNESLTGSTLEIGNAPKGAYTVALTVKDQAGNATTVTYNVTISSHNSPVTHAVLGASTANPQGGNTGGQVLGDNTTTPNTPTDTTNGQVKGDSTANTDSSKSDTLKASNQFLGLGWWWLLVLAVIVGFFLYVFAKADEDEQKS